jgi:hypothetical protein
MYETINRDILILKPRKPLLDWVNYIFPDNPITIDNMGKHDSANVYLIPEMNSIEHSVEFLKQNFTTFLEEELYSWCEDEELWPEKRDWKLFEEWLDYEIHSVVTDMDEGVIVKEDF